MSPEIAGGMLAASVAEQESHAHVAERRRCITAYMARARRDGAPTRSELDRSDPRVRRAVEARIADIRAEYGPVGAIARDAAEWYVVDCLRGRAPW